MGFLDSLGDFATGAIDTHLARLEDEARKKHELALTEKAMEQRTTDQWMQDRQQRKMEKMQGDYSSAEAAAKRKAERESEEGKQKWEREKLTTEEAGRDRRASMRANAPKGESTAPKPPRMEFREVTKPDGRTEIHGFDPVTGELKTVNGRKVSDAKPTDPNAWLSQF